MSHSFPIQFQPDPLLDKVTVALMPVDGFTGQPVRSGVEAWLLAPGGQKRAPYRTIRNLSGQLVFVNLPAQAQYDIEIDASEAGYINPPTVNFIPAGPGDPRPANDRMRHVVWLQRRQDAVFDDGTTLVRGVVIQGGQPSADVTISIVPVPAGAPAFETLSDAKGAFALAMRLPKPNDEDVGDAVTRIIRFAKAGTPPREMDISVHDGRAHLFSEPIILDGLNEPPFAA